MNDLAHWRPGSRCVERVCPSGPDSISVRTRCILAGYGFRQCSACRAEETVCPASPRARPDLPPQQTIAGARTRQHDERDGQRIPDGHEQWGVVGQCMAYKVAARAPASNPAAAPDAAGERGAPARNAKSVATSDAVDSRGMATRQIAAFVPIARAYQADEGTLINSQPMPTTSMAGAMASPTRTSRKPLSGSARRMQAR